MKHITHWSPDTCGCTFEYEWDDELPEEVTPRTAVKTCPAHSGNDAAFGEALAENQTKNRVFGVLERHIPGLEASDYEWSFDAERKLSYSVTRGSAQQRQAASQEINRDFRDRVKR